MKAGFGTGVVPEAGAATVEPAFIPPSLVEMANLFPQLEIVELLGRGGMGAVYKARQPALDRWVALKILPPQSTARPGFTERFNREARALARLNHANIVALHEFGQVGGMPYFLMEYVEGMTLRRLVQSRRLEPREALKIVPQICEALQFAHDEGVVHRDIKPENILMDKRGRVKIADFGIAKIAGVEGRVNTPTAGEGRGSSASTSAALTEAQVLGTPNYMAPEQIKEPQSVDHRADIYSLGVVFYEMLTGELPQGKFQPPSKKVQVDVRLDEVVLHALEKEPARRYQQASEVKTAVETITNPAPGKDRPIGDNEHRTRANATKMPALAVGIVIVILGLLGGLVIALNKSPQKRAAASTRAALPKGLIAWWSLDGNASDGSGVHHGSITGNCVFRTAVVGEGIFLEGLRSGISVPDAPEFNFGPGQDFSVEAWILPWGSDTEFGVMDIVDKREAPDLLHSCGYAFALRNGKLSFLMADSLAGIHQNWEQNGPDLRDGKWHHVAVTVQRASNSGVKLYVDGQIIATFDSVAVQGSLANTQPLLIGMHPTYPNFRGNFRGGLDEVALYNRALAPEEIQTIHRAGAGGKFKE